MLLSVNLSVWYVSAQPHPTAIFCDTNTRDIRRIYERYTKDNAVFVSVYLELAPKSPMPQAARKMEENNTEVTL